MIKAPSITSLRVAKLAANFIHLKWDDAGGNFYYIVERRLVSTQTGDILSVNWEPMGYTGDTEWFDDSVIPQFTYQYRIRTTYNTFEPSDWVDSDELLTFPTNAYMFTKMNDMTFATRFLDQKFTQNRNYVDFNSDAIMAGLMGEDFVYNPEISNISSVMNMFVTDPERHEIQGSLTGVCKDRERTMICEIDGILYLFERYQQVIKVSNDGGQNWVYYQAFNGRVGNPVSRQCTYHSHNTTFVLGYNEIFFGRPSTDTRWSDNITKFSDTTITFAKIGDDDKIGFPVEIFGSFIDLPADLNKRAEAMACNNDYLFVAGRGYVRRSSIVSPVIDPATGKKTWEAELDYITADHDSRIVIKKLDVLNGKLYALVSGRVKLHPTSGTQLDPTVPDNVEQSDYDGIYVYDQDTRLWDRIYGNTAEERKHISHENTNMSTDGREIFFTYDGFELEIINDPDLPVNNSNVTSAVKFSREPFFAADKQRHYISFRTSDSTIPFKQGPERYHGEEQFVWNYRSKTLSWINPKYRAVVVYSERRHEYQVDEDLLVNNEVWDKGEVTIHIDTINFKGFSSYANGILLYRSTGEIIGYYEFLYRVRDEVTLSWKPDYTLLHGTLIQQDIPVDAVVRVNTGLIDPNFSPLLTVMGPEHYYADDSMFRAFADSYLQFLSTGESSHYNKLKNLIRNKYPKEEDNFEHLFSEINKRNIYLDANKRNEVVRFFETRASDFYSTKGVVESYKFLFKLLYNADVDLEVESLNGLEYDIVINSENITEDIVGTTVYTPTGRANVTYIEREYQNGVLQWRVTIHNLIGKFMVGQVLNSESYSNINGMILVGVRGKELSYNDIDYINRGRVYYTMKIKSELPLTRYRDDIIRFVHPVGFGFLGVTLITVLINSGISFRHVETIINLMKAYKWDAGVPKVFPDETYRRDVNGNTVLDPVTGVASHESHPLAGKDPIIDLGLWPNYDTDEQSLYGKLPSERRCELSPVFDAGWITYAFYSLLEGKRLKDRIGLPRDPSVATQIKVEE